MIGFPRGGGSILRQLSAGDWCYRLGFDWTGTVTGDMMTPSQFSWRQAIRASMFLVSQEMMAARRVS